MKRSCLEFAILAGMVLIIVLVVLCAIDQGTAAPSVIKHCVVSEKKFVAAHTQSDGDNITYVKDKWTIMVTPLFVDVDVTQDQYEKLQTGRKVDILVKKGGVVGGEYYSIAPNLEE